MLHYGITQFNSHEIKKRDAVAMERTKYKGYIFLYRKKKRNVVFSFKTQAYISRKWYVFTSKILFKCIGMKSKMKELFILYIRQ